MSVILTDDPADYPGMAGKLGLEHRYQSHVRRWVRWTLQELKVNLPEEWHGCSKK